MRCVWLARGSFPVTAWERKLHHPSCRVFVASNKGFYWTACAYSAWNLVACNPSSAVVELKFFSIGCKAKKSGGRNTGNCQYLMTRTFNRVVRHETVVNNWDHWRSDGTFTSIVISGIFMYRLWSGENLSVSMSIYIMRDHCYKIWGNLIWFGFRMLHHSICSDKIDKCTINRHASMDL